MVTAVLALLLVLLTGLFVAVDAALSARLHSDLRTRLTDRVQLAEQLADRLGAQDLVDRLRGDGVTAQLCSSSGCVSADTGPPPPGKPNGRGSAPSRGSARPPAGNPPTATAAAVQQSGPVLYVRTTLPNDEVLTLSVDSTQVGATLNRLIVLEVVGGAVALLLAALLLGRIATVALRPLDRMTTLARRIAAGDRGRRLGADGGDANTELGRTATAFDAMLDELESALAAASAAEARLRAFLDDVSHELRTPLAGVQATTETLLRDEPDHAGRERAYVTLVRETRRANRLVDDLLTMTRLDTGMRLSAETVALRDVVRHELDRLTVTAPGLRLDATALGDVDVVGDPVRLGQIVANLLDNARAAAGPTGRVWVSLRTEPAGVACLEITDDGPGVPPDERERIFARLVRLDGSRARMADGPRDGFGLGLPIARALARAHGGDLECTGQGPGATFRLTVPITPSITPAVAASITPPVNASITPPADAASAGSAAPRRG